jgi:hypothetical protein
MGTPGFLLHAGGKVSAAKSEQALPANKWSHLAGVYDGERIALYVDGVRAATEIASGMPDPSREPLYLGAMPRGGWSQYNLPVPSAFWMGSIDDRRLSRGARYQEDFVPATRLEADGATIFHLPCDLRFDRFTPAAGEHGFLVPLHGQARVINESRGD